MNVAGEDFSNIANRRVPALDGVRGIAILLVLVFHAGEDFDSCHFDTGNLFSNVAAHGHIGVDLFFVLSGLLITSKLIAAKHKSLRDYLLDFYKRRICRIFPLYYLALAVVVLVVCPVLAIQSPDTAQQFVGHKEFLPWLWFYGTNIAITITNTWLFGNLDHFWSLAVEEHFYLFWPLLVFLLSVDRLRLLCMVLCVVAFVFRWFFKAKLGWDEGVYVFTLCRIDQLAIGALLACMLPAVTSPAHKKTFLTLFAASGLMLFYQLLFNNSVYSMGKLANKFAYYCELSIPLVSAGFFALFIVCGTTGLFPSLQRVLSHRALIFFGKYSYGLYVISYLFRVPTTMLPEFCKHFKLSPAGFCVYLAASLVSSVALAVLSYNAFEKRFLSKN